MVYSEATFLSIIVFWYNGTKYTTKIKLFFMVKSCDKEKTKFGYFKVCFAYGIICSIISCSGSTIVSYKLLIMSFSLYVGIVHNKNKCFIKSKNGYGHLPLLQKHKLQSTFFGLQVIRDLRRNLVNKHY